MPAERRKFFRDATPRTNTPRCERLREKLLAYAMVSVDSCAGEATLASHEARAERPRARYRHRRWQHPRCSGHVPSQARPRTRGSKTAPHLCRYHSARAPPGTHRLCAPRREDSLQRGPTPRLSQWTESGAHMSKLKRQDDRAFELGDYWLSKRPESRQTRRASLGAADFEEAKLK